MARVGIIFGLLLCGVTVVGLVGTNLKSPTQFFPMMLGIPILFCGVVALNPHRRKAAMHSASGIALLGALVGTAWIGSRWLRGQGVASVDRFPVYVVGAMSLFCAAFVVIAGVSFIEARRRKLAAAEAAATLNLRRPDDPDGPKQPEPSGDLSASDADSRESA